MPAKRTLAEELAELATPQPAPEADFEADELAEIPTLEDGSFDLEQEQQPSRKAREKRNRLRADIDLQGAAYNGKRTSRAAAFDAATSSGDSAADSQDDSYSTDAEAASEAASEAADAASSGSDDNSGSEGGISNNDGVDHNHNQDDGEDAGASDVDQVPTAGQEEDQAAELERQYAEAAAQDQIALADMKDRTSKERTKGLAVLHQKQLWDQNLQTRILLQRCLQAANRMPYGPAHTSTLAASQTLAQNYAALVSSASDTIDELLSLHAALVDQHPAAQQIVSASGGFGAGERSRGEEEQEEEDGNVSARKWRRIDEEYCKLVPFRDASVDRWHRKTMLISGAGAVKGNLRALNQSVSSQVEMLMKDPTKLARRAGLSTEQRPRVLCQAAEPAAEPVAEPAFNSMGKQSAAAGLLQNGSAKDTTSAGVEELDLEAFDDGEFYAQLLKEFLDSSGGAAGVTGSALYPQGKKKRKQVDRRASKGRKLRYHIQDKLVNFMAPVEQAGHEIAAQLFGSLFGGSQQR